MANRRVLERLWRLRGLEEEQSRMALEACVAERNRAEETLADAGRSVARSRGEFVARLGDANTAARAGALLELERNRRYREALRPRLASAEAEVLAGREEFLLRRTGRRQVETLLEQEQQQKAQETARRAQQMLDDWYGRRTAAARAPAGPRASSRNRETDSGRESA